MQAAWRESRALRQQSQEAIARVEATRAQLLRGRSRQQVLRDSTFARLAAKQETMAVVEQAKGIIMARRRCGTEEAFDLLRRASQRTNVKVDVLAAQIVRHVTSGAGAYSAVPMTVGAERHAAREREPGRLPGGVGRTTLAARLTESAAEPAPDRADLLCRVTGRLGAALVFAGLWWMTARKLLMNLGKFF